MKRMTVLILVCMLLLSGCGGRKKADMEASSVTEDSDKAAALVIVAGKHANACMYDASMLKTARKLVGASITETKENSTYYAQANVSVIISDGKPALEVVELDGEDILSAEANNTTKLKERVSQIPDKVIEYLQQEGLRAQEEEVDLLQSLYEAKNVLDSMSDDLEKHILILDTGFTTHGYFNMVSNNIMEGEVSDVISRIDDGGIPDLTGVNVTFLGLGNVAGSQQTGNKFMSRLKEVWTEIITAEANAVLTEDIKLAAASNGSDELLYAEDGSGYPAVTPVGVPSETTYDVGPDDVLIVKVLEEIEFEGVYFEPNTAVFRDENAVRSYLNTKAAEIGGYLSTNSDDKLYVVGSIAKTKPGRELRNSTVSADRAEAIAKLLIHEYNVPADRIVPIDAGTTEFSWRNTEEFPGGKKTEDTALLQQKNRKVLIFGDCSEELVQELRDNSYID